jgi:hypothetical protein
MAALPLHTDAVTHQQGVVGATEERTTVLFVHKKNAKEVKTALQQSNQLDRTFRMTAALVAPWSEQDCIAIPILLFPLDSQHDQDHHQTILGVETSTHPLIQGQGVQCCPFSTAVLGNHTNHTNTTMNNNRISHDPALSNDGQPSLTTVQRALVETLLEVNNVTNQEQEQERSILVSKVLELNMQTCPKKLEKLGDDTLVIPPKALHEDHDVTFRSLFPTDYFDNGPTSLLLLWKTLARLYNISRVCRRGDIDPDSKIRHSGHRILFPECELNANGIPVTTGTSSEAL